MRKSRLRTSNRIRELREKGQGTAKQKIATNKKAIKNKRKRHKNKTGLKNVLSGKVKELVT